MNIQIQSVKFDADQKLIDFVQHKVGKLDRKVDNTTGAEVTLKLDKDDTAGNKVVMLRLAVPGHELVAERRSKSFEESVDLCVDAIKRQIERYKEK
ncbi:HPF/RaiA family ribosome-associated protein [uncultured Rikenella sp.]|uniref:HPF/RaiA family ribosome-associated protein n=1 Tax=uncultured Rikenella sp. TaxID=368003 RepID=UPI0025EB97B7|nr:HPF/RaiA family ribosome-associated protein [uncultured Rikenella sp.]